MLSLLLLLLVVVVVSGKTCLVNLFIEVHLFANHTNSMELDATTTSICQAKYVEYKHVAARYQLNLA